MTKIIESQVRALKLLDTDVEIKIIVGSTFVGFADNVAEIAVHDELSYLDEMPPAEVNLKHKIIIQILKDEISKDDIVHCHNLNIGKNPILAASVYDLVNEGYKIFLHCHDFAEDRPPLLDFSRRILGHMGRNYDKVVFPEAKNCLFGVLTSTDLEKMHSFGVPRHKIHVLHNPVDVGPVSEIPDKAASRKNIIERFRLRSDKKIFTYPVRAIRRKNIGELLLLSALFREDSEWLITLAPNNPEEKSLYEEWVDFAGSRKLPVHFNVGTEIEFKEIISGSDACIMTSVMEGFGMGFLEPWLFGKSVFGRNLPNVTKDFKSHGMIFPLLYDGINIPLEGGKFDFGHIGTKEQMKFIDQVLLGGETVNSLIGDNPVLGGIMSGTDIITIENNKKIINSNFSLKSYGEILYGIYGKMDADCRADGSGSGC